LKHCLKKGKKQILLKTLIRNRQPAAWSWKADDRGQTETSVEVSWQTLNLRDVQPIIDCTCDTVGVVAFQNLTKHKRKHRKSVSGSQAKDIKVGRKTNVVFTESCEIIEQEWSAVYISIPRLWPLDIVFQEPVFY
jgi:hypothetical protein